MKISPEENFPLDNFPLIIAPEENFPLDNCPSDNCAR